MKCYELAWEQFVDQPIDKVFDFFSRPENLEEITLPRLGFTIMTSSPIPMNKGSLIDYTIRILGFSVHWRTLITFYDLPMVLLMNRLRDLMYSGTTGIVSRKKTSGL